MSLIEDARKFVERLVSAKSAAPPEPQRQLKPPRSEEASGRRMSLSARSSDRIPVAGWEPGAAAAKGPPPPDSKAGFPGCWCAELARRLNPTLTFPPPTPASPEAEDTKKATLLLITSVHELAERLSAEFNEKVGHPNLRVTATGPLEVHEQVASESGRMSNDRREFVFLRCRVSSSSYSLSARGREGMIEFFILPVGELMLLSRAESSSRLKLSLRLCHFGEDTLWTLSDGMPIDSNILRMLVRDLFAELILTPTREAAAAADLPFSLDLQGEELARAVNQLVTERQNLVQKIVTQQEEIQNSIARELHDAVIADVMMLKRSLAGDRPMSKEEVAAVLDQITRHLREICHDLSPRDLKDWGLQTVVEDLLERVSERTGADCALSCDGELPDLPSAVQLHIYRIVQECLNNIEKYAEATRILVRMAADSGRFVISIEDDGKGFDLSETDTRRSREGGCGMGSIRERAALIRCFFPTDLKVGSEPNKGSKTTLEVRLTGASGHSGSYGAQSCL